MVSFISRQFITRPDWGNCRGFLIPITGTCSKRPKSTLLLQEVLRGVFSPDAVPLCVQSPSGVDKGAFQVCIHYPDILRRQRCRAGQCPCQGGAIFGDLDGVLVIPKEIEEEVVVRAIEKAAGEKMVAEAIKNGMAAKASFDKYGIM